MEPRNGKRPIPHHRWWKAFAEIIQHIRSHGSASNRAFSEGRAKAVWNSVLSDTPRICWIDIQTHDSAWYRISTDNFHPKPDDAA